MHRTALAALALSCTRAMPDADPVPLPPPDGPSCAVESARCEASGGAVAGAPISCCDTIWVGGGTFLMGFSLEELGAEAMTIDAQHLDHDVTVSGFFLDRFEITRARFFEFVAQYSGPPLSGSGAHPKIDGTGWQSDDWDPELLTQGRALSDALQSSASSAAPEDPTAAMSGLTWFEAFAFCAWDGGRLPTEAEWEFAAAGGRRNSAYPWGDDSTPALALESDAIVPVGSNAAVRGHYGHDDLAGGVLEWVFDWFGANFYVEAGSSCFDCANLDEGISRVVRGGSGGDCCGDVETEFRSAARNDAAAGIVLDNGGARCARDAPSGDTNASP